VESFQDEWENALENLVSVLEDGADLRITRRPMIGIMLGDFSSKIASQLGVPVDYGMHVSGVLDGMGAKKAGLQADDVVVAVDGHELTGINTFTSLIMSKHAGDVVNVSYFRGAERKSVKMTLSGRPIPSIPGSSIELSRQLEPYYRQFEAELENILNDATQEECANKPKPGEWSVNEVLAHLIHSERGWLNYIGEIISGREGMYDGDGINIQAMIDGTVVTFITKDELLKELKQLNSETINLVAHIAEDFASHKGKFWKLVYQAHQNPNHYQVHLDQIRAALQSARNT
jgi:hypothetical protein